MPTTIPRISMKLSARYVTSSHLHDKLLIGNRLTDSVIRKYELQGRYGPEVKLRAERRVIVKAHKQKKQTLLQRIQERYGKLLGL